MSFKLEIKLVPEPLWNQNLRKKISKYAWRKLRIRILAERGLRCEVCGKDLPESKKLYAHEEWNYDTSQKPAIAQLSRIILSCWHCHAGEHFGRTLQMVETGVLSQRAIDDTIAHFCHVNEVGRAEFTKHEKEAWATWRRLNKLKWEIDWGQFGELLS